MGLMLWAAVAAISHLARDCRSEQLLRRRLRAHLLLRLSRCLILLLKHLMCCLSCLVLHFCALLLDIVILLMCIEYGGIFELVFITVVDDLMKYWRVEREVVG